MRLEKDVVPLAEMKNSETILVERNVTNIILEGFIPKVEKSSINFKETECEGLDWIRLP
jgi:hypothetical protein